MQPAFSALAGLWRGAVGEVVVGHAVEQAVEEVGWVGGVGRSQRAGETRSSLQGEIPSMTAAVEVVEVVICLVVWLWSGWSCPGLVAWSRFTLRPFRRLSPLLLHS